jgi:hypothetical protein
MGEYQSSGMGSPDHGEVLRGVGHTHATFWRAGLAGRSNSLGACLGLTCMPGDDDDIRLCLNPP